MSKKIMKRSLALGALMAFVITGSAMAADETISAADKGGLSNVNGQAVKVDSALNVDGKLTITSDTNSVTMYGYANGDKREMSVTADSVELTTKNNTAVLVAGDHDNAHLTFNVEGEMKVSGTGEAHGIAVASKNGSATIYAGTLTVSATENAVYARNEGANITVNADYINITSTGTPNKDTNKGFVVNANGNGSSVTLNASEDVKVEGTVKAIATEKGTAIDLLGKNITISAGGNRGVNVVNGTAVDVAGSAIVRLGSEKTESININNASYGILAQYNGTTVDVKGQKLNITGGGTGVGIWAMNGNLTDTYSSNNAKVIIDSDTATTIKNVENAIYATSQATIDIAGDLYAKGTEGVIDVRGGSVVNVNKSASKDVTVQLEGDIVYELDPNDIHPVDATLTINLANENSYFKGNIYKDGEALGAGSPNSDVKGMKLSLSNGAKWELSKPSVVNQVSFGKDTVLILKEGSVFEAKETGNVYALNAGEGTANKLIVDNGAKLQIGGIKETTYNIATSFANYNDVKGWTEIADNALMKAELTTTNGLQAKITAKGAEDMATDIGISTSTAGMVSGIIDAANIPNADYKEGSSEKAAVDFIQNVVKEHGSNPEAAGNAINAATKMAEAGGNNATAASIVKNVTGVTNDRLSFNCGHSAPHKGGHDVGLFEEGSGADIWVEYVHGKDEVEDMPSTAGATSYEGSYDGIVFGMDFKKVNKFQSGVAFNYGEGDTNSVGGVAQTRSDYDFWGVGYYGSIHNDDSNVIFDVNYAKTDSEVTQYNSGSTFEAEPETTTWSAGVKVEKLYQNENVQIVPYTGLRYMSIDGDDYSTKCGAFNYSMDRQDIWLLPVGVSLKQEVVNDNGWTVSPRVDVSYIWAFGDTNSNMEVKSPFAGVSQLGYDVMDDGSFLGLVGIEAHKGQWGYGVSYSYQKGDHSESKKWFVDVNYSF